MIDDITLLRRYAAERSEPAFTEFVSRNIPLVYGAALRRLGGDPHRAGEITQQVFISAAKNAGVLARHANIVGWLYAATRNAALNLIREEQRRRQREQVAHAEAVLTEHAREAEIDWARLRAVLDDAIDELNDFDREAVLLRFFSGLRLAEVGARLHVSENAARMRVERALEKLQALLAHRGLTSTTAALTGALVQHTGAAVPAGLAASVSSAAVAAGAAAGAGAATFLTLISAHKTAALTLAAVTGMIAINTEPLRANTRLHHALTSLELNERELARVREEHRQLIAELAKRGEIGRLNTELETLRRKVSRLKPPPFSGFSRLSSGGRHLDVTPETPRKDIIELLSPGGLSSPMRAWQTMLGAGRGPYHDMELQEATFCFEPEGNARVDAFLAKLPESVRAGFRLRESVVAPGFDQWLWKRNTPQGYSPDRDVPMPGDPTRADSYFKITYASGEQRVDRFPFKRFEDGWRFGPLTAADADALLALLDPGTGRPKPPQP